MHHVLPNPNCHIWVIRIPWYSHFYILFWFLYCLNTFYLTSRYIHIRRIFLIARKLPPGSSITSPWWPSESKGSGNLGEVQILDIGYLSPSVHKLPHPKLMYEKDSNSFLALAFGHPAANPCEFNTFIDSLGSNNKHICNKKFE